jgi:6-phosphogluconolactonase/glucosamine-6-phosphate isomerase/deaminase
MITFTQEVDPDSLKRKAGERLTTMLSIDTPTLFLCSGGSSLALLDHIDASILSSHCVIGMVDDRWSLDPTVNNFLQFEGTKFGQTVKARGLTLLDTVPLPEETLEQTAIRFEKDLRAWRSENPEGQVVITQGMGPDGHTVGILPFPEAPDLFETTFNNLDRWTAGYDATGKNPYPKRITVTLPFLRAVVDYALMYLASADKEVTLQSALETGPVAEVPARIIQDMKMVEVLAPFLPENIL